MLFDNSKTEVDVIWKKFTIPMNLNKLWVLFLAVNHGALAMDLILGHFPTIIFTLILGSRADNPAQVAFYPGKYVPVIFSILAGAFLLFTAFTDLKSRIHKKWLVYMSLASIAVGLGGFYYHIEPRAAMGLGNIFEVTIYGSPLFAPLVYVLLGIYTIVILLNDHDENNRLKFVEWFRNKNGTVMNLLVVTAFYFLTVTLIAVAEHFHNYYHSIFEWIPLLAGFWIFFFIYLLRNQIFDPAENENIIRKIFIFLMFLSIGVGTVGFLFHLIGNFLHPVSKIEFGIRRIIAHMFIGSPILAPLLFINAAIFGLLSVQKKKEVEGE